MKQLHRPGQHAAEYPLGVFIILLVVLILQAWLDNLNIPVAEVIPNEVIQLLHRKAQLVLVDILRDRLHQAVELGHNPLVLERELFRQLRLINRQVHLDKTRRVPNLVGKVAAGLYLFCRKAHIISWAVARHQREAQRVRAILADNLQRVNAVAE